MFSLSLLWVTSVREQEGPAGDARCLGVAGRRTRCWVNRAALAIKGYNRGINLARRTQREQIHHNFILFFLSEQHWEWLVSWDIPVQGHSPCRAAGWSLWVSQRTRWSPRRVARGIGLHAALVAKRGCRETRHWGRGWAGESVLTPQIHPRQQGDVVG